MLAPASSTTDPGPTSPEKSRTCRRRRGSLPPPPPKQKQKQKQQQQKQPLAAADTRRRFVPPPPQKQCPKLMPRAVGAETRHLIFAPLAVEAQGVRDVHIEGVQEEGAVLAPLQLPHLKQHVLCAGTNRNGAG